AQRTLCTTLLSWSWIAFPVNGPNWFMEVTLCNQVTFVIDSNWQLWQRVRSRPKDDFAFLGQVEGGLVAKAQQVVGVLFVKRNWGINFNANLGVSSHAIHALVFASYAKLHRV